MVFAGCVDRRFKVASYLSDVSFDRPTASGRDRTAMRVTKYDYERYVKVSYSVLDGTQFLRRSCSVPCITDTKYISCIGIEDHLDRHP